MKILLTGNPRIGKSTVLAKTKEKLNRKIHGIIAKEVRNKSDEREGFVAVNPEGKKKIFSHKHKITSKYKIKDYNIDVDIIDSFVVPELRKVLTDEGSILMLDEIGRMQAFSSLFLKTLDELFSSRSNVLGTIVYEPEPWSIKYKKHEDVVLVEVTEQNRDDLPKVLGNIYQNPDLVNELSDKQRDYINQKLREYFSANQFTQISKLFNNSIPYVLNDLVKEKTPNNKYAIMGNHGMYEVTYDDTGREYSCTCDLYNGKNKYSDNQGECSHIQSLELYLLN